MAFAAHRPRTPILRIPGGLSLCAEILFGRASTLVTTARGYALPTFRKLTQIAFFDPSRLPPMWVSACLSGRKRVQWHMHSLSRRLRQTLLAILGLLGVGGLTSGVWAKAPNLVFIIADDCTYRDIGCYGGQAHTPNLDRLAREGMRFERCFQAAPMCSPTRHNLFTGLYPVKSGAYPNHTMAYPDVKSIVHYLKPLGYRVVQTGKTHFNPPSVFPFEFLGKGKNPDLKGIDGLFAAAAAKGEPFALFACSNEPHLPWNKGDATAYPPDQIELPPYIVDTPVVRENFARYLAEITYFDDQVGSILASLARHGLEDETLVMVVSEQGNAFPFAKWTCYDSGLQSAMIVRWPGHVAAGSVTQAMVEYVDVTPTFIDLAGGEPVPGLDGRSFRSVLDGETQHHKDFVFGLMTTRGINRGSEAYAIRSVRGERFKLIRNLHHESTFQNACTSMPFFVSMVAKADQGDATAQRFVHAYQHRPAVELYDLEQDPFELNNLAGQSAFEAEQQRLSLQLEAWMRAQGDAGRETEWRAPERQRQNMKNNRRPKLLQ